MPKTAPTLDTPFRKNEKVLTTRELSGLPEGSRGKVRLVNGLNSWVRYWVKFDSGDLLGQISQDDLVRLGQVEEWQQREEDRLAAAENSEVESAEAEAAPAGGSDGGAASLIPAHLLERSKAAKARLLG